MMKHSGSQPVIRSSNDDAVPVMKKSGTAEGSVALSDGTSEIDKRLDSWTLDTNVCSDGGGLFEMDLTTYRKDSVNVGENKAPPQESVESNDAAPVIKEEAEHEENHVAPDHEVPIKAPNNVTIEKNTTAEEPKATTNVKESMKIPGKIEINSPDKVAPKSLDGSAEANQKSGVQFEDKKNVETVPSSGSVSAPACTSISTHSSISLDKFHAHMDEKHNPMHTGVHLSDFDVIGTIGKGGFGKVMLVKRKEDHKEYAMKVMDKKINN